MRKIIGMGETILDILFRNNQPQAAVPGGSVYNSMISLGRMGMNVTFVTEIGDDRVGHLVLDNMRENGVSTDCVNVYRNGKSPVSLAFLNEKNDAEYVFYKDSRDCGIEATMPVIDKDDIVIIGSYFVVAQQNREKVKELLDYAREREAIIYYDVNFRTSHANDAIKLMSSVIENFEYADILRGSTEDFQNLFKVSDPDTVYKSKVGFYCRNFICTDSEKDIHLYAHNIKKTYSVKPVQTVSTIGAGDNFNAGLIYGLVRNNITRDALQSLAEEDWDKIVRCGMDFSANVCQSVHNSISREFADSYR